VLSRARDTVDDLLAALLASPCSVCGRVVDQPTRGAACEPCWSSIRFITPPYCVSCGEPFPSTRPVVPAAPQHFPAPGPQGARCSRCLSQPLVVDVARALGPYEGALRDLLHGLKYHGRRSIAPRLAALVRERCAAVLLGADAVVPVPLHRAREWSRGFNQAEIIARGLGPPVWRPLRRTRHTVPQSALPATERWHNVRGAFGLRRRPWDRWNASALAGRCIVLVDDVSTTGATLDACAAVLKAAGVAEVRAVTVARAVLGHAAATGGARESAAGGNRRS
jgi:ComF family protein